MQLVVLGYINISKSPNIQPVNSVNGVVSSGGICCLTVFKLGWYQRVSYTYHHGATVHDKNPVRIHDCVQSMGDCKNCAVLEFPSYCLLHKGVSPATENVLRCVATLTKYRED
jgi:hypothetical protein